MWKVLLVISAVVLLGGGYLAYDNKKTLEQKNKDLNAAIDLLAQRKQSLAEKKEELAALEQSIVSLKDEAEKLKTEKIDLDSKLVKAQSDLKELESQKTSATESLEEARKTIDGLGEINRIQQELASLRAEAEEAEIEVAQMEGQVASEKVTTERQKAVAAELEALRQDQSQGVIRGEFQSTVKRAYNKWGFVVVNGGNDQGVVDRAQLDVYRQGQPICKLLVSSVEPAEAVADIIPGSLVPGQTVQEGDTVVKSVRAQTPIAPAQGTSTTPTTPQQQQQQPAGGMGEAEPDPFGGGGGMDSGGGASEPDPFGGGGGMDSGGGSSEPDPFGGGGGMDSGGGSSEPDPFQ